VWGVRKEDGRGEKGKRDGGEREGRGNRKKESEGGGRMMILNGAVSLKLLPTCTEIHTISNQHSKASKQLIIHGPMIFTVLMIFTVMTY